MTKYRIGAAGLAWESTTRRPTVGELQSEIASRSAFSISEGSV